MSIEHNFLEFTNFAPDKGYSDPGKLDVRGEYHPDGDSAIAGGKMPGRLASTWELANQLIQAVEGENTSSKKDESQAGNQGSNS